MNIFSFTAHFGTEEDCRNHFKSERDKAGILCKCGHQDHFWIKKASGHMNASNVVHVPH